MTKAKFQPGTGLTKTQLAQLKSIARARMVDASNVSLEHRKALLSAGTIEQVGGCLRVTPTGRATLKRLLLAREEDRIYANQHQIVRASEQRGEKRKVADHDQIRLVNHGESPLTRLALRQKPDGSRYLTITQLEAGERLRRDFERSMMVPSMGIDWDRLGQGGGHKSIKGSQGGKQDLSDSALQARIAFQKAQRAVGDELSNPLVDFCCYLKGLEEIEKARDWPARSGKQILSLALSALARHYGLGEEARGPLQSPMQHWGCADYRPKIS